MDLYKVYDLPGLNKKFSVQFSYIVEGYYLAASKYDFYAALATEYDIQICMPTQGYLCMMNQALYSTEQFEWCFYALFISDREHITKHCMLDS